MPKGLPARGSTKAHPLPLGGFCRSAGVGCCWGRYSLASAPRPLGHAICRAHCGAGRLNASTALTMRTLSRHVR
eukprot:3228919-Heterocapsa_arctica.AAC.1